MKFTYTLGGWALIIERKTQPHQPNKTSNPATKIHLSCSSVFVKPELEEEQPFLWDGVLGEQLALSMYRDLSEAAKRAGVWSVDTATQMELPCKSVTIFRSCAWLLGSTKQDIVSAHISHIEFPWVEQFPLSLYRKGDVAFCAGEISAVWTVLVWLLE